MPNTKAATKALRQSQRRRLLNIRRKRAMTGPLKAIEKALKAGNKDEALKLLPKVQKELDKSARRNIITKNTASRTKSRLSKRLK
ncbi:MAG: 30S ribosomal protein S20 [bacterium]|nr:30S ribosomal protein S20 [bacterium]